MTAARLLRASVVLLIVPFEPRTRPFFRSALRLLPRVMTWVRLVAAMFVRVCAAVIAAS